MLRVIFPLQNKELYVNAGETVAAACSLLGRPLDLTCGGKGTCKKCSIVIKKNGKKQTVLACQEKISEEIEIYVDSEDLSSFTHILTSNHAGNMDTASNIKKIFLDKSIIQTPSYEGDWENILNIVGLRIETPSLKLLKKLSTLLPQDDISGLTLVFWKDCLIEIEENDTSDKAYGLAIDLGTTTIVAYLHNLSTGERIGIYSCLNAQTSEGADVISRISASVNNPNGAKALQDKVTASINGLIEQAVKELSIPKDSIYNIVLAGNSAMQHLFLGLNPVSLGKAPYTNTIMKEVIANAQELSLNINPNGIIQFMPLIGGFVGADTTAVILSLNSEEAKSNKLIIDLGTNGEILLGNEHSWLSSSTAAGPALEGANITFGMRGTTGAIEKVTLTEGKVQLKVIGEGKPKGICGSGIIDAIAQMLKTGIITEEGKLLTADKYLTSCKVEHRRFTRNLEKVNGINVFILADELESFNGQAIYISQKDIRAVQLAKSAIFTGCMVLLKEYGLPETELSEILLAGAFGNYIDVNNAQCIGLIPKFDGVPVRAIGNAAGSGSVNYLLSKDIQQKTLKILEKVRHIDLASNHGFVKEYLNNTSFGQKTSGNYLSDSAQSQSN